MSENPTVLVLAEAFPPSAESGVYRTFSFVKYLERSGWSPVVLTLAPEAYRFLDEDLGQRIPEDLVVYRTRFPGFVRRLQGWVDSSTASPSAMSGPKTATSWKRLLRRLNFFLIPDTSIAWLPYAVRGCVTAVRRHRPRVLLASAPPASTAVIGMVVSRLLSLPLIVDFRDGWTVEPYYRHERQAHGGLRYGLEGVLEPMVFRRASRVLCQQAVMARDYRAKYPRWRHKISTLNNGFDEDDFVDAPRYAFDRPTLLHAGYLEDRRNPENLFRGLAILRRKRPDIVDKWRVVLVGRSRADFPRMASDADVGDLVQFQGQVSHRTAVSMMLGASGLLLLTGGDESELPGKLFDYLGSRRPIFAVAHPEGESARVIKEAGAGMVVPGTGPEDIAAGLELFMDRVACRDAVHNETDLYPFTRRYASEQLATVLDDVSARKTG